MARRFRRTTLVATCTDDYQPFLQLVQGTPTVGTIMQEIVEGTFNVLLFGATMAMVERGSQRPTLATVPGQQYAVGAFLGLGPTREKGAGYRLDELWVANTTAGSNARIVFVGVVEDVEEGGAAY